MVGFGWEVPRLTAKSNKMPAHKPGNGPEPVYPNQDPRWPNKDHFEPTITRGAKEIHGSRRCQKWVSDRSKQCTRSALEGRDYCVSHGGAAAVVHEERKSRRDFLRDLEFYVDGDTQSKLYDLGIKAICQRVMAGDTNAIKYYFDQLFGGPTSTVEIVSRDMFALMVRVTARHLKPEAFEVWLSELKTEMERSGSEK